MAARVKALLIALMMVFSLGFLTYAASPAMAGGPIVYNQRGNYVPMYYAPTPYNINVKNWMPNSTRFNMRCYEDFQWFNGNYGSYRWYYGQAFNTGQWGYVHSSYVYYQWSVPRC